MMHEPWLQTLLQCLQEGVGGGGSNGSLVTGAGIVETKDIESEDPTNTNDLKGTFSDIQFNPNESTSPVKKPQKSEFQQGSLK
jgi:hypothetical protein